MDHGSHSFNAFGCEEPVGRKVPEDAVWPRQPKAALDSSGGLGRCPHYDAERPSSLPSFQTANCSKIQEVSCFLCNAITSLSYLLYLKKVPPHLLLPDTKSTYYLIWAYTSGTYSTCFRVFSSGFQFSD